MLLSMNERRIIGGYPLFGNEMSMRFLTPPDGDDDTGGGGGSDDNPSKKNAKEGDADFDKDRQKKDQDAANERKYHAAQAEAQAAKEQAEKLVNEKAELEQQMSELRAKAADQGIEVPELKEDDYVDSDLALVRAIKALNKKIDAKDDRIKNLEGYKSKHEKQAQELKEIEARNKVYDGLLDELDGEYGAQHRNAAVAAFDELIKDGKIPKGNPAKATRLMEKCYRDAKSAAEKTNKDKTDSVNLDTGAGGGKPSFSGLKLKPGSLAEVEAQVEAAIKT